MYVVMWFWAVASAFSPVTLATMSSQAIDAQTATIEAVARPLMTLGWLDEEDAAFF